MSIEPINVVAIGDCHYKVDNLLQIDNFETQLFVKLQELRPDLIVMLGDTLDRHELISIKPLKAAISLLERLMEVAPVYLLIGNHDRPNNSTFLEAGSHGFGALHKWDSTRMTVVDVPIERTIKGHRFIFVPYVYPGRFREALLTLEKVKEEGKEEKGKGDVEDRVTQLLKGVSCIFAHQEFLNAKMGAMVSISGDPVPTTWPLVVSGHIHDYQELQDNLIYTGSAFQHAYNENEVKTISYFSFSPGPTFVHQRIDLQLLRKRIVRLSTDKVLTWTPTPGDLIKLVIEGTADQIRSVTKLGRIRELQRMGIKISYRHLQDPNSPATTEDGESFPSVRQMRYLERLSESLQADLKAKEWFEKLFGKSSV